MPKLYLRMLTDAVPIADEEDLYDLRLQWLLRDNDGSVRGHGETDFRGLADVADPHVDWLSDPDNTLVFIPSQFVLRVACKVPGRSTAQIRRALPFAAEEFVASDIETMHIAHDTIRAGQPVECNIVSHEQMENWLACLAALGVTPGAFIADAEVLPRSDKQASVLFDGDTVLIADASQAAVIDRNNLGFALATLQVERLVAINGEMSDLELSQQESPVEVEHVAFGEAGLLEYLADQVDTSRFINLLQGTYQPVRKTSANAGRWRSVGALAAAWIGVAFVAMLARGLWSAAEADRLQAESFAFYQELFPRESQPVSIDQLRRRMAAKLGTSVAGGEGRNEFVELTGHLASVLPADNQLQSLGYSGNRGELSAEVLMRDYEQLEVLKTQLAALGVGIDVTNADQDEEQVRARVRVKYQ